MTTHAAGPEDEASAMAMVTEAAVAYDKYSPAAVSLAAFEGATMSPLVFREQLRRCNPRQYGSPFDISILYVYSSIQLRALCNRNMSWAERAVTCGLALWLKAADQARGGLLLKICSACGVSLLAVRLAACCGVKGAKILSFAASEVVAWRCQLAPADSTLRSPADIRSYY